MADEMERLPAYFDPELPNSFRFIAEATQDPQDATKAIVYGAVRSAKNVASYLAGKALEGSKKAIDTVVTHLSKMVATGLLAVCNAHVGNLGCLADGVGMAKTFARACKKPS